MCDFTEALSFAAMDRRPPNGAACTHPMVWKVRGGTVVWLMCFNRSHVGGIWIKLE